MALISCYDLNGVEHKKEHVDARECVTEMGWSLEPKIVELEKTTAKLTSAQKKAAKAIEIAEKSSDAFLQEMEGEN